MIEFNKFQLSAINWPTVSAIAGTISALAALFSVSLIIRSQKRDRESRQAYFRVVSEDMQFSDLGQLSFPLKIKNAGQHSAIDIEAKLVVIPQEHGSVPFLRKEFLLSNELGPEGELDLAFTSDNPVSSAAPWHIILLSILYQDPILTKKYEQRFFFQWEGSSNGRPSHTLTHCRLKRKQAEEFFVGQ